ncbi:glycosyltransferase family 2 protein [Bifidobacterium thermophilum]|uniref:Glycosyltransferase n=1 Tax=Bifidobacterium thermophilum TaxID=33905 RepID=A0A7X9NRF5_9BIFI|nr:glycosyltransferase family 2 protein [Bifidobacterium thermophilum]NME62453.1 glycosyltransferase [Bifidobacterium thermophilum]
MIFLPVIEIQRGGDKAAVKESVVKHPFISFVVIAYNESACIERCLDSLKAQTSPDFEAIVVDDASTDSSADIIEASISGDRRFKLIKKSQNGGAHLARKTGVSRATGEYVIFVDGDDEISPELVKILKAVSSSRPDIDIWRFGINVKAEGDANQQQAYATERMFNDAFGEEHGTTILMNTFSDTLQNKEVWSVCVCMIKHELCVRAFMMMTDSRLGYMEDSYEFFILVSEATSLYNITDVRGLQYHIGAGRSGRSPIAYPAYTRWVTEVYEMVNELNCYVTHKSGRGVLSQCLEWLKLQYLAILGNEWVIRLNSADQTLAIDFMRDCIGDSDTLRLLLPPLVARCNWILQQEDYIPQEGEEYYRWAKEFQKIDRALPSQELSEQRENARKVVAEVASRVKSNKLKEQSKREQERLQEKEAEQRRREAENKRYFSPPSSRFRRIEKRLAPDGTFRGNLRVVFAERLHGNTDWQP